MPDTIAMPPRKTYPGVLFPLSVAVLSILIALSYSNYILQKQVSDLRQTVTSLSNHVQQINRIVLSDGTSLAINESDTNPEVLAETQKIYTYPESGLSFRLPAGFSEQKTPVQTTATSAANHLTFLYKNGEKSFYTFTLLNARAAENTKLNLEGWELSAEVSVDELNAKLYKKNASFPDAELFAVESGSRQLGFLFVPAAETEVKPELSFDDAVAKIIASLDVK